MRKIYISPITNMLALCPTQLLKTSGSIEGGSGGGIGWGGNGDGDGGGGSGGEEIIPSAPRWNQIEDDQELQ